VTNKGKGGKEIQGIIEKREARGLQKDCPRADFTRRSMGSFGGSCSATDKTQGRKVPETCLTGPEENDPD